MFTGQQRAEGGRRTLRARKVSQAMATVDEGSRIQVTQARLDALEADNDAADNTLEVGSDDDEVTINSDSDGNDGEGYGSAKKGKKGKKGGTKRKLKGGVSRGVKTFTRLLEEFILDKGPERGDAPSYLTAAVGPARTRAPRHLCSVCGQESALCCVRCRSRYCSRRCLKVHSETRCLKFAM